MMQKLYPSRKMIPSKVHSTAWSRNFFKISSFLYTVETMIPSKVHSTAWSRNFSEISSFLYTVEK